MNFVTHKFHLNKVEIQFGWGTSFPKYAVKFSESQWPQSLLEKSAFCLGQRGRTPSLVS